MPGPKRSPKKPIDMLAEPEPSWSGPDGRERAREATRWVLAQLELGQGNEEGAGLARSAAHDTGADFVSLGLGGMLSRVYGDSARRDLADVLPDIPDILEMPV